MDLLLRWSTRRVPALLHDNFGSYSGVVTSPQFGALLQNLSHTYRPRTGQLAFRVGF